MIINTFYDGEKEKSLYFHANGERTVYLRLPHGAIVKSAFMDLEGQELPDQNIIRIGLVKNCSLEDFNTLETRLEETSWGRSTMRPGWGSRGTTSFVVGGTGRYTVIPIEPTVMITAHPSYYRRNFDLVIIPNGPLHADLSNLVGSGVPVVTMAAEVAQKIGIASEMSLEAALSGVRIATKDHYITEMERTGPLSLGVGETMPHVQVRAMDATTSESTVVVDTGMSNQGIVITALDAKLAYFGAIQVSQIVSDPKLFNLFKRTIEWGGIGGYITKVGVTVGAKTLDWSVGGELQGLVTTPNFAPEIAEYMRSSEPDDEGMVVVPITFKVGSPGILVLTNVTVEIAFLYVVDKFEDEKEEVELIFDSVNPRETWVEVPTMGTVLSAVMRAKPEFTRERIANRSLDETENHGVMVSSSYVVGQEIHIERTITVSRIGLNLAKVEPDGESEVLVEIRGGYADHPTDEVLQARVVSNRELDTKYRWVDVDFPNLVLTEGEVYWIVLKAKKGKVQLHADPKCPSGGLLRFSKDGGRTWKEHGMDALYAVYYKEEAYRPTPDLFIGGSDDVHWSYEGEAGEEGVVVPDFAARLNAFVKAFPDRTQPKVRVPLTYHSESIGTLLLSDLRIEVELPTKDAAAFGLEEEELEVECLLDLIERVKKRVQKVADKLGPEMAKELKIIK